MTACAEYEPLLLDRAAGALAPDDAARLEAHLSGGAPCVACLAEVAAFAEALELCRLPPPSEPERRAFLGLGAALEREARAAVRRRAWPARVAAVVAVAAALVAFLVAPAFTRRGPKVEQATPQATAAWEAPDPDALLEVAGAALTEAAGATALDAEADPIQAASAGWKELAGDSL